MNKPFISVVTVCRNSEKTIARTIESVLAQEFKDYEYIIVDGASSDRTVGIIGQYEPLFEGRMHWTSEPDKGIYDAFNKGIRLASGVYVWIVNSDDFMEKDALNTISSALSELNPSPCAVLGFNARFVKKNGETEIFESSENNIPKSYRRDWPLVPHPSTVVPKEVYVKFGMYDDRFKIMADIDWFHNIYKKGVEIIAVPKVITNMTEGGISTSGTSSNDFSLYLKKNFPCPFSRAAHWSFKKLWELVHN